MKRTIIFFSLAFALAAMISCSNEVKQDTPKKDTVQTKSTTAVAPQDTTPPHDGSYEKRFPNGNIYIKGEMRDGKRDGVWTSCYQDGRSQSQNAYSEGKLNGKSITWYPNGQIRYEGTYTDDKQSGVWKYYDETGKLVQEINYDKPASK